MQRFCYKTYEALDAYDQAIEIDPNNSLAWYDRACIYSLRNNKDQSILNLKKAIELYSAYKEKAKNSDDFKGLWKDKQFKQFIK